MTFTRGHAKTGGRKRGARNRRTLAAAAKPNALDHLVGVVTSTDPIITPEMKLRAAVPLSQYQHAKPAPSKAIGRRQRGGAQHIARITSMIAKVEIDGEHGARIIAGLEAFLAARAAELEAEVERHRAEEEAR
jgi:hypothetical protein